MMIGVELLHPEDVLYFAEVASTMRRVARQYNLYVKTIGHLPEEQVGFDTDQWGDCDNHGNIRLLIRAKVDGKWTAERLSPESVWEVAAHELAHLRHQDHSDAHRALYEELRAAISNQEEDHRAKVLKKLVKMQAQRDSEGKIGNSEAADAFAGMINKMLLQYELSPTDIDYARAGQDDPVIEVKVEQPRYGLVTKKVRSAWQESLARVVARAHLCQFLIRPSSNDIWFAGTRSHAVVAEYVFGTLVQAATAMAERELVRWYSAEVKRGVRKPEGGFKAAWLNGFITRIGTRFDEERRRAAREYAEANPGTTSETALVRLDGALIKVREYIDDKFRGSRRAASAVRGNYKYHAQGGIAGRAAADRIALGRQGLTGGARGELGS